MKTQRLYANSFSSVYPYYVAKATKKERTQEEVNEIICWLTGYSQAEFATQLENHTGLEAFYAGAPRPNPARKLITGMICGVRVEDIQEPTMQAIRYLDKLIDELAKGRPMNKILRIE
jgi:hypothetical protein